MKTLSLSEMYAIMGGRKAPMDPPEIPLRDLPEEDIWLPEDETPL